MHYNAGNMVCWADGPEEINATTPMQDACRLAEMERLADSQVAEIEMLRAALREYSRDLNPSGVANVTTMYADSVLTRRTPNNGMNA